jgi:hypothetical protein
MQLLRDTLLILANFQLQLEVRSSVQAADDIRGPDGRPIGITPEAFLRRVIHAHRIVVPCQVSPGVEIADDEPFEKIRDGHLH